MTPEEQRETEQGRTPKGKGGGGREGNNDILKQTKAAGEIGLFFFKGAEEDPLASPLVATRVAAKQGAAAVRPRSQESVCLAAAVPGRHSPSSRCVWLMLAHTHTHSVQYPTPPQPAQNGNECLHVKTTNAAPDVKSPGLGARWSSPKERRSRRAGAKDGRGGGGGGGGLRASD